jgi:hypothetical protein
MSLASWFKRQFRALMKLPETHAEKRILNAPREALRRLKPFEKEILGLSRGAEHYVSASIKKVTPRTVTVPVARYRDKLLGVSHSKAAAERKAGLRGYKTAASEEQARKQQKRSQRLERRKLAAEKEGFNRGGRQRRAVLEFLNEKMAQHDRYLDTGRGRLDADEYRKTVRLAFEYFGDDDRTQRLAMSYTITAAAA